MDYNLEQNEKTREKRTNILIYILTAVAIVGFISCFAFATGIGFTGKVINVTTGGSFGLIIFVSIVVAASFFSFIYFLLRVK